MTHLTSENRNFGSHMYNIKVDNYTTHPFPRAQKLMTRPVSSLLHNPVNSYLNSLIIGIVLSIE